MATETQTPAEAVPEELELPAGTGWPFVMAVGITLMAAGVVTNYFLTLVGVIAFLTAAGFWAWLVFAPGVGEEHVPVEPRERRARTIHEMPGIVETMEEGMAGHRLRLPEKIHPYSAGAKGGLVGAFTMAIPALLYGIFSHHGIWYPVNLLVGMLLPLPTDAGGQLDMQAIEQFRLSWFLIGLVIHLIISVGLGLMYGVILPMLPTQRPIFWGGVIAPLLWTGAAYGFMGVLNPTLARVVDWPSFIAAQFIYGLTVGIVVLRSEQVYVNR
jgi:hypothetical protein